MVPGLVEPIFLLMYSWRGPEKPVFNLPSRFVAPPKSFLKKDNPLISLGWKGIVVVLATACCDLEWEKRLVFTSTIEGLG